MHLARVLFGLIVRSLSLSKAILASTGSANDFKCTSYLELIPNPDEPEPNKASLQIFLLKKQEFHWLGPNTTTRLRFRNRVFRNQIWFDRQINSGISADLPMNL